MSEHQEITMGIRNKGQQVPVVAFYSAQGGVGNLSHLQEAVLSVGVSAVAAGSFFTFHGKHKAVLLTYPAYKELKKLFEE